MTCSQAMAARCEGGPAAGTYRWLGRREPMPLCPTCVAVAEAMGLFLIVERRAVVEPVAEERRRPAWLDRLRARDLTDAA